MNTCTYVRMHACMYVCMLPAGLNPPPKTGAYKARQQALWNAAADGGKSRYFKPKPQPTYGVPLKGAYRCVRMSVWGSVCLYGCLCLSESVCLSVSVSVCMSVCMDVCVCLYVGMYGCLYVSV